MKIKTDRDETCTLKTKDNTLTKTKKKQIGKKEEKDITQVVECLGAQVH